MKTSRRLKTRRQKAGLPPGSLVHIGERLTESIKITLMDYDGDHLQERALTTLDDVMAYRDKPTVTWLHIDGIHDIAVLEKIGAAFSLHPLTLEDILNTDQRPKVDDYDDYLFIVLKAFSPLDMAKSEIRSEQVSVVFGARFLISFTEKEGMLLDSVRERLRSNKGRIRKTGCDYLAYSIIDTIVDQYFLLLESIEDRIDENEEKLINRPIPDTLYTIQHLKQEMLFLRKSVWPLREAISYLERTESVLITPQTGLYLKDVYDHTIQIIDTIETQRDILSSLLDIYLSSISNRLNEVMKVLTIIATIFMPLTFLAGVYGMNFKYMPELEWRWGYFFIWGVMLAVGCSMVVYFKRKKWL